jgi:hypothetical protein
MNRELQDKLISAEAENPQFRAEYERRLTAMLETPLTWYRKSGLIFGLVVCAATVVLSGVIAFNYPHAPPGVLAGRAVGVVFGLAGLIIVARILYRGVYRLGRDSMVLTGMMWGFVVLLEVIFLMTGGIDFKGIGLVIFGLVLMIGAGVGLLRTVIEQSELRTREKLLELELRLSKIDEDLGKLGRGQ